MKILLVRATAINGKSHAVCDQPTVDKKDAKFLIDTKRALAAGSDEAKAFLKAYKAEQEKKLAEQTQQSEAVEQLQKLLDEKEAAVSQQASRIADLEKEVEALKNPAQ